MSAVPESIRSGGETEQESLEDQPSRLGCHRATVSKGSKTAEGGAGGAGEAGGGTGGGAEGGAGGGAAAASPDGWAAPTRQRPRPAPPQGRGRERADAHVAAALMKPLDAWSMHAALRVLTGDFLPARWVYPKRRQIEFIHVYGLDLDLFMSTRYESKLGRGQAPARKLASTARISQLVVPSAARWLIVALPTARSPRGGILGLQARALRRGLRAHAAGACDDISRKFAADRGWRRDAAHQSGGLKSAAARMAGSKVSALTRQSSMPLGSETMAMSSTPSPVSSSIS